MSRTAMQRGSEKRKSKALCPKNNMQKTGMEKHRALTSAAVTTDCCAVMLFLARYFVMSLETVSGMPDAAAVARTANTERAIW